MKIDLVKAILANTDKCLANPTITGDLRKMLEAQKARLMVDLFEQSAKSVIEKSKSIKVIPPKSQKKPKKKK